MMNYRKREIDENIYTTRQFCEERFIYLQTAVVLREDNDYRIPRPRASNISSCPFLLISISRIFTNRSFLAHFSTTLSTEILIFFQNQEKSVSSTSIIICSEAPCLNTKNQHDTIITILTPKSLYQETAKTKS